MTGGGTLNAESEESCGIYALETNLAIKDCIVNAKGNYGITGQVGSKEKLLISNATVTAEGRVGSICDFKEITLEDCAITQPAGAVVDKGAIRLSGEKVTSEVKIVQTKYDLWINDTQVTSDNCGDLSGIDGVEGTVKYDPDSKTLTLEGAKLNVRSSCIGSKIDGLTIKVSGTNELNAEILAAVAVSAPATITGGGTLNVKSEEYATICAYNETDLTIKDCIVNAKGKWGIAGEYGSEKLLISNATVRVEGENGSICSLKEITLEDCAITQPAGAVFDESKHAVVLNGEVVTSKVVIEPVTYYALEICGTQVTSGNCGDLSVIDGVEGTVKYEPESKTLTLENATIYTAEKRGIRNNVDGQTILLFGENTITSKKFDGVSNGDVTLTITGSGKLTVNGAMTGVDDGFCLAIDNSEDGTVIIDGCTLEASAGCYGFSEGCWKFINCTVRVKGGGSRHDEYAGSICNLLEKPTFIGCAVISPAKAYWGDHANISDETRYDLYGEDKKVVTDWVTIADPTGINTPTIDIAARSGIYTLSGVKLGGEMKDLPKGVYIVNGKKVVK
ncbi:peptidase [Alloprevotella tannerae]|uniref:peptidase n=1 Tax=Alloprevotella tannerae TaxID=76122 RepID=UPI003C6FC0DA